MLCVCVCVRACVCVCACVRAWCIPVPGLNGLKERRHLEQKTTVWI